ncbi:MAG TPA: SAM-dependent methyltransferase, partial [Verrucomicrobiae bacterium]|nr:SAM-dependent methyltransferase [Verrucomicrobiae bacterium]
LAGDILRWLHSKRPELFERFEYGIIEPSQRRREWQKEKLLPFAPRVRWYDVLENLGSVTPGFSGIIFCNELLDSMPVRRLGWDAKHKKWFEWGVTLEAEKFVWARCDNSLFHPMGEGAQRAGEGGAISRSVLGIPFPSSILDFPSSLLAVLPDNYTIEISPAAENWWRDAANVLERGRLMTIDYGFTSEEMVSPGRNQGTLRGYIRHRVADDVLANAGEQDITAHVNFSAIQAAGESAGLKTEMFSTQAQFLTRILGRTLKDKSFGEWDATRTRQFQTLTHPEHLGRPFRVLVQSR